MTESPGVQDGEEEVGAPPAPETPTPGWVWVVLLAFFGGVGWLFYRLYPAHHARAAKPTFIDNVFANNLVLFASRLVLIAGAVVLAAMAVFVVMSVVQRARAGHWLSRFGPLETQAVEDLSSSVETYTNLWLEAAGEADELRGRIEESDGLIAELNERLGEAVVEIERLQGKSQT